MKNSPVLLNSIGFEALFNLMRLFEAFGQSEWCLSTGVLNEDLKPANVLLDEDKHAVCLRV